MKVCTLCKISKHSSEFRFRADQNKHGTRCKSCDSLATKARFFKVTKLELIDFIARNNHVCGICGVSEATARAGNNQTKHYGLYIDHDHESGLLRGMLCHNCNLIIGHAKDNVNTLHRAIKYLT